jgi:phenylpropionate dioxygenase-like ring-hydroxylating dioxygenase large terminal subunit
MDKATQNSLAKRLIAHLAAGTTDAAPEQMRVPIAEYTDPQVWNAEVENLYKRKPVVAALSCELPGAGSFLTLTMVGTPILLTRTKDGLKAFLNVCRHRGATVAPENCSGRQTRFSCPYHGWAYDNEGRLLGVANAKTFGPIDVENHGLTELAVAERSGLIFVVLTPGISFDVEEWMAGADLHMGLDERHEAYQVSGSRTVEAANWKLVIEGHLESYHFAQLHRESVGRFMETNCTTFDRFGSHILITFCQKTIQELRNRPEEDWEPLKDEMINPQYLMFPGTMVTIWESAIIAQIIQPGKDPGSSLSRIVYAAKKDLSGDEQGAANADQMLDYIAQLVENEDYFASFQIQRGLNAGAQKSIVFGRNELGPMLFHENLQVELEPAE